jgi:hypothetical protein
MTSTPEEPTGDPTTAPGGDPGPEQGSDGQQEVQQAVPEDESGQGADDKPYGPAVS